MNNMKATYWKIREEMPRWISDLRKDPPSQRMYRHIQTRFRRTIELGGLAIRLSPDMGSKAVAYMLSGAYERPERRIIDYALEKGDRVLELGTGIGYLSALCARKIGSDRVFTYEANPLLRARIAETYSLNGVSPHVEFCMLGERAGETSFYVTPEFWSSTTVYRRGKARRISVPVKEVNEVLAKHSPNFLIIDIEGGEADLVRYMRLDGINKVCIELHPYVIGITAEQRVRDFFIRQGFCEDGTVSDEEHVFYRRDDMALRSL